MKHVQVHSGGKQNFHMHTRRHMVSTYVHSHADMHIADTQANGVEQPMHVPAHVHVAICAFACGWQGTSECWSREAE